MKPNRSLAISSVIQECKMSNSIGLLENEFPSSALSFQIDQQNNRNRVFTLNNTLLTMVLTSIQQDKTLKNSVDLYYMIHQRHKEQVQKETDMRMQKEKKLDEASNVRKAGRPKKYSSQLPKSLEKDISLNTAAYSKARERLPIALVQNLFDVSRIPEAQNVYTHWHGYRVMIGDGTYVQMQDTPSLREKYEVKYKGKASPGYPQGLLETITERGTGQLYTFRLSNRHVSELELFYEMIDELPERSLLLLDDLYNCYEIIAKCKAKSIEIVVPAKRKRDYVVKEILADGDEIIEIKAPKSRSKWLKTPKEIPRTLLLRRIRCKSPDGKEYDLYTTILNKDIKKDEIQTLYLTRWDIEISIREVKTIMDINILRSKTPDMALKELTVSLATYNLIRKIIYASIKDLPFSPEEDFIYKFYTLNKDILIDKKGRLYNRWSTGRKRVEGAD